MTDTNNLKTFRKFPPVTTNLIIINILVYLARSTFEKNFEFNFLDNFALHDIRSNYFRIYQIITSTFINDHLIYFVFYLLVLWLFVRNLENMWGSGKFFFFYLICQLGCVLLYLTFLYYKNNQLLENSFSGTSFFDKEVSGGRSVFDMPFFGPIGFLFAGMAAYSYTFPNQPLYIYFLLPLKAKWAALLFFSLELINYFIAKNGYVGIIHLTNLGAGFLGFLVVFLYNKINKNTFD